MGTTAPAPPSQRRRRPTRQRQALTRLLEGLGEFTSAQELHSRLRAGGERVGLTTVYNQLRALAEEGEVDSVRGESGEVLYRRCELGSHHHHLVCRSCGVAIEVDLPDVEEAARKLAKAHGFADARHVLEISGLCRRCQQGP